MDEGFAFLPKKPEKLPLAPTEYHLILLFIIFLTIGTAVKIYRTTTEPTPPQTIQKS